MTMIDLLNKRQSCRNFDPNKEVPKEILEEILEAARLSPSACNAQPYQFVVARGEEARFVASCRRHGLNKFIENCPAFILIFEESYNATAALGSTLQDQDYRSVDIGIATAFMSLRAEELGLGSCILGYFDEPKLRKHFKIKKRLRIILALGYAHPGELQRSKKRKTQEELTIWV